MIRRSFLIGCAAIALCLAGCSAGTSSNSPTTTGPASPSPASPSSSPAPAPQSSKSFGIPSDCPTSATVSSALGVSVPEPQVTKEDDALTCVYISATQDGAVVMYQKAPAGTDANTLKAAAVAKADDQQVTQLNGIGDIAFAVDSSSGFGIVVLSGDIELFIAGGTSDSSVENFARTLLGQG